MSIDDTDSLFNPKHLYRSSDPFTSRLAAESSGTFRSAHHRKIYEALKEQDGTPYEIAKRCGLEVAAVFRRMNELEKTGKIHPVGERRGPSGRLCRIWSIT